MEDIRSLLSLYKAKKTLSAESNEASEITHEAASSCEIPDVFFDTILIEFKLSRSEVALLMLLYRQVWCRPNLYVGHGIGPLNAYHELAKLLNMSQDDVIHGIRSLEGHGLLQTVRAGQYFIRKYFTEEMDTKFGQRYEF